MSQHRSEFVIRNARITYNLGDHQYAISDTGDGLLLLAGWAHPHTAAIEHCDLIPDGTLPPGTVRIEPKDDEA